jgi:hypothetical protein
MSAAAASAGTSCVFIHLIEQLTGKENTMEPKTASQFNLQEQITSVVNTMISVITNPAAFFKSMPRTGGFNDPLIFVAAMGVVGGVLQILLSIFGLGMAGSFFMALAYIIIMPIASVLFSFVGGAVLYLIWKVMGSREEFEAAYRCAAYTTAIGPIMTILNLIPYLGAILVNAWMAYLLVTASVEVHELQAKPSWIVFGIIAGLLTLASISTQYTARKYVKEMEEITKKMGKIEEMTPEEAGRKVGEFLKGMEKGAGKQ